MWNDDWREELKETNEGCYTRLCECRNTKNDIVIMSSLMHKYNPNKSADDCFERMLEWVGGWNNQWSLVDSILIDELNEMLAKIK